MATFGPEPFDSDIAMDVVAELPKTRMQMSKGPRPKSYDFLFFHVEAGFQVHTWIDFCLDEIRRHGVAPSYITGKSGRWIKAPRDVQSLRARLQSSACPAVQGGVNSLSSHPFDGWGISFSVSEDGWLACSRFDEGFEGLVDWGTRCVQIAARCGDVAYGYGYSGDSPNDGLFGRGMISGHPSARAREFFSDEGGVANWFRAKMWKTFDRYIYGIFPFNVVVPSLLEAAGGDQLKDALDRFGKVQEVRRGLLIWTIESAQERAVASVLLQETNLMISRHQAGQFSQRRPPVPASHDARDGGVDDAAG